MRCSVLMILAIEDNLAVVCTPSALQPNGDNAYIVQIGDSDIIPVFFVTVLLRALFETAPAPSSREERCGFENLDFGRVPSFRKVMALTTERMWQL